MTLTTDDAGPHERLGIIRKTNCKHNFRIYLVFFVLWPLTSLDVIASVNARILWNPLRLLWPSYCCLSTHKAHSWYVLSCVCILLLVGRRAKKKTQIRKWYNRTSPNCMTLASCLHKHSHIADGERWCFVCVNTSFIYTVTIWIQRQIISMEVKVI